MANPQIENGYLKIANDIVEAIYSANFTGIQTSIILFVLRFTYGFNKKKSKISNNFIASGIKKDKSNVSRAVKKLIELNVLTNKNDEIGLNKDFDTWNKKLSKSQPQVVKFATKSCQNRNFELSKSQPIKENNKNKIYINNNYNIYSAEFEQVAKAYEENIGIINPIIKDTLINLLNDHSADLVIEAIAEASKANARNVRYIEGIFRNWDSKGVKSVSDAALISAEKRSKQTPQAKFLNTAKPKKNAFQDYNGGFTDFDIAMMKRRMNKGE